MKKLNGILNLSRRNVLSFVGCCLLLGGLSANAAPLNLNLQYPDITTSFMNTNYDAGTDLFEVTYGLATTLNDGVTSADITGGTISLTANISGGGIGDAILNSGTFTITGTSGSYNSGTLLTGNLTEIGYANNSSQILEFIFDATGGDLLPEYENFSFGGIIFSVSGYNDDNFNSSFSHNGYGGFADIAPVPVPAALWLFGSGLIAIVGIARRRA